ncbi:MAG: hypothetical protein GXP50_12255 [Deltaproteobacteria bacterium]|nr:hypothetical protein [Deltaproteobacteria bacterium]
MKKDKQRFQYLCRIYALPAGEKEYVWRLEGFEGVKKGAGCRVEITGDRRGWHQRVPEFDRQIFWGLMIPRGQTSMQVLRRRGVTERVRALGCGPAVFCDEFHKDQFGGWYRLGFRVAAEDLSAWEPLGGLPAFLDAVVQGLEGVYRLCDAAFGSASPLETVPYPTKADVERVLRDFAGSAAVRVPVRTVLDRLAGMGAGRWAEGWRERVRASLPQWLNEIRAEEEDG